MSRVAAVPAQQLIDGKLVGASDGATYPILNPATGEEIGQAPDATADDVDAAIAAARRAFDETDWSTDLALRVRCLRQLHQALVDHGEEMRALTTAEVGAPAFLTAGPQYDVPVEALRWIADLPEGYDVGDRPRRGQADGRSRPGARSVARPSGVVAAITPWNFPNQINLAKVGPALAAGNTVVLKPAPDTPWVAAELGRLAAEHTDLPPGVLNVVTPRDNAVAAVLATDPRVDLVSFTGSTATGRAIMAAAAPTLKKVFLELGGKSAAIVLDDADLAGAVGTAAFSVCIHAGQGCALTTRLLVPRDAVRRGRAGRRRHDGLDRGGDPTDPGTICGPVISAAQRDRIARLPRAGRARRAAASPPAAPRLTEPGGLLGRADRHRRPDQRRPSRPRGDLRSGARRAPPRRRRRRRPHRQRLGLRPVRLGRLRRPRAGAGRRAPDPHRHARRSTAGSGSRRTRRSAATSSPASAGRWASPASRSTSRPS